MAGKQKHVENAVVETIYRTLKENGWETVPQRFIREQDGEVAALRKVLPGRKYQMISFREDGITRGNTRDSNNVAQMFPQDSVEAAALTVISEYPLMKAELIQMLHATPNERVEKALDKFRS